ncbi:CapA family protein [Paenibacillus spongiae]|uniref:CapA family protein n=1 Tax=Paenibacillus spongiae TaxID=2909671 RepID=A0ABY5S503_9BACL|nr:CapA family protein [Paenibacillus spongiae]UVI28568.1 CapA family protein [Paenibacillus spongiae]
MKRAGRVNRRSAAAVLLASVLAAAVGIAAVVFVILPNQEKAGTSTGGVIKPGHLPPVMDRESYIDIKLAAAGDIMFHNAQLASGYDAKTNTYRFNSVFDAVKPIISAADLAIANFETTTAGPDTQKYSGYPRFNSPDEVLDAIKYAGFDILSTANNHSLDTGRAGLIRTVQMIRQRGLDTVGTYEKRPDTRVLMKNVKGIKLAFMSYTESANGLEGSLTPEELDTMINMADELKMKEDIQYAKDQGADVIIAFLHWGNEYERTPSKKQEQLAKLLAKAGVDIILGSHPHVIQRSEQLGGRSNNAFVIYSMGNFISNQRYETLNNAYTEDGVIVLFDIQKNKTTNQTRIINIDYVPTWVYRDMEDGKQAYTYQILPILNYMDSKHISNEFKARMQRSYKDTIMQLEEVPPAYKTAAGIEPERSSSTGSEGVYDEKK